MPDHDAMVADLQAWGFTVGARDPRLNTLYPGAFMVVQNYEESELPTPDGRNGPWCIVGDDLPVLVEQAWDLWVSEYDNHSLC